MRNKIWFVFISMYLFLGTALAGPVFNPVKSASCDTINLYGGPGILEGKFETAGGLADQQGWTTLDNTAPAVTYWTIDQYQAANLDPGTPGNHAWWCGEMFEACPEKDDLAGGYGDNWNTSLGWSFPVLDNSLPAVVTITAVLNSDTEPGYDYTYLRAITAQDAINLLILDEVWVGLAVQETFTYQPGDFLGESSDQVQLRFSFESDPAWSDEDCLWPTVGAVQVDQIQVTIQQQGLPDIVSPVETCEPGDPNSWEPLPIVGVGDFAQLWSGLDDLDPDQDNHSPQWAFLDDGEIVPGTDGSYCEYDYWCYGPDNLVVNMHGGLLGPGNYLNNSVISPPIALPAGDFSELLISLDAYLHNEINQTYFDPVYLGWVLESTADPAASSGWTAYENAFAQVRDDGSYERLTGSVPVVALEPGALFVRLVVSAGQIPIWDWGIHYPTPAPYFDNVRLQAVTADPASPVDLQSSTLQVSCSPNPFNPAVEISWYLPQSSDLSIRIYDLSGALVRTLLAGPAGSGNDSVVWRGDDDRGQCVSAGVYFCRVTAGAEDVVRKLVLLK